MFVSLFFLCGFATFAHGKRTHEASETKKLSKFDSSLLKLVESFESKGRDLRSVTIPSRMLRSTVVGEVIVEVVGGPTTEDLVQIVEELGLHVTGCAPPELAQGVCSVVSPISSLQSLADHPAIKSVSGNYMITHNTSIDSQGSKAMFADQARTKFDLTGKGVLVCVISDSYNCAGEQGKTLTNEADDVASGDLPDDVRVFRDVESTDGGEYDVCSDEGRAMVQLVHDIAPGANLGFYAGSFGLADFARAIVQLGEEECCDVIVDDLSYYNESPFQDDLVAQAVDRVVAKGVTYFSAAGNENRQSWEGFWVEGTGPDAGFLDFGGGSTFLDISVFDGTTVYLYWDDPKVLGTGSPGPKSDLDLFVSDGISTESSEDDNTMTGNPYEVVTIETGGNYFVEVKLAGGLAPGFVKLFFTTLDNPDPDIFAGPTALGHNNAAGSIVVGAASFDETPGFDVSPAILEDSSSPGGVPILFDTDGNRLDYPIVRQTPAIVGPDGTCTTFFGQDDVPVPGVDCPFRFFGSSAAAPSVAGVAALMLELDDDLTPAEIRAIMTGAADDMDGPSTPNFDFGFDFDSGFGFLNANEAVETIAKGSGKKGMMGKTRSSRSGKGSKKCMSR
eukprot:scaffold1170_cov174-Amphora_coffeaeformis.AAC.44